MIVVRLQQGDPTYPATLREYFGERAPTTLTALGNLDILLGKKLALFCSVKCPGTLFCKPMTLPVLCGMLE